MFFCFVFCLFVCLFSASRWLRDAEAHGESDGEKTMMRWNAATQVTFWEYPQPIVNDTSEFRMSNLQDYACKTWGGLVRSYYRPR